MKDPSHAALFFALQWPDRVHDDRRGTDFPDHEAARAYARRIVRELKEGGGYDAPGLTMIVRDRAGNVIHAIPLSTGTSRSLAS